MSCCEPHPTDPDIFFGGTNNGSFLTRLNRRTGEFKEVGAYPRFFSGEPSKDVVERWQWTYPIIFSSTNPNVLYTSSQRVWKTTNGGVTLVHVLPSSRVTCTRPSSDPAQIRLPSFFPGASENTVP